MLKKGKEEIIYLLNKSIEVFEIESGNQFNKNTNKKNYEPFARMLSTISNELPYTSEKYGHLPYEVDPNKDKEYTYRKYDITGGQIRDALMGLVANPRSFLIDSCYIYLFGKSRLEFEKSPTDQALIAEFGDNDKKDSYTILQENQHLKVELSKIKSNIRVLKRSNRRRTQITVLCSLIICLFTAFYIYNKNKTIDEILKDFNVKPYAYTKTEKDALEGIWLNYIGSPQARISDPDRERLFVLNITEIKEKNGYFLCTRYGSSFNHTGYAQFESPKVVSVHLKLSTLNGKTNSPRHSLLLLDSTKKFLNVISASWNYDVGEKNKIIGVREVYTKIGKGGKLVEILNAVENAECKCKIVKWEQPNGKASEFHLKNMLIDTLQPSTIRTLIDSKSILFKDLEDSLLLKRTN